jgi:hypothetical protein
MFIAHVLHGCLVLFVFVFGLPFIFLLAVNILTSRRAPTVQSLHVIGHLLHAVYKSVSGLAEGLTGMITQRFPANQGWMKPLLKPLLTIGIALIALYFISNCC